MARKHWHPSTCRVCGKTAEEVGSISQTGKCIEHAIEALEENVQQMVARSGPNFTRWRRGMAATVGAVLLDDLRESV